MCVVLLGLGVMPGAYAVNATTALGVGVSTLVAAGRPYHHLQTNRNGVDKQQVNKTVVVRTKRGHSSRPYHHLIKNRTIEQTEFAAMEAGKTSKSGMHRSVSQGGKPYRIR